ncbi:cell division protein FtsZ [Ferruginibacter sp. HRS2-29]|uniref:cell division protein FtsZ n=1 Tax=Ferruginibacter sp. HRS2-29 TaxID=2487334 RepID=UPI0020CF2320|nr:cell division protein FtsZ [Ferruginibacter sp. HRS2-29]MCP9752501.1 cell division protein FtsZ [Ferruginibacter sp. HRS2-29]
MIQFDLPKDQSSIIKVIGVGGGGSNAVNHMFSQNIEGVDFIICNTDAQAVALSSVPNKIQLGPHLTQGLGAGANPMIGRQATEESLEEIKRILEVNTKMAFITAGMGGGTGTGGAPILAKICKDLGILTVGIVTTPFAYEGKKRIAQAEEGIMLLKNHVDTLLVISNDKLRHQFGNLKMKEAFAKADNVLATAAKCITDVINSTGQINVDFADVCTVMSNGGVAILGSASAEGENRAFNAIENALTSPLLNDNDIRGAKWILININSAEGEHEFTMDEVEVIQNYLLSQAGEDTDVILGLGYDNTLGAQIGITLIATGFEHKDPFAKEPKASTSVPEAKNEKIVMHLDMPAPVPTSKKAQPTLQFDEPVAEEKPVAKEEVKEADPFMPTLTESTAPVELPSKTTVEKLDDAPVFFEISSAADQIPVVEFDIDHSIPTPPQKPTTTPSVTAENTSEKDSLNTNVNKEASNKSSLSSGGFLAKPAQIYAEVKPEISESNSTEEPLPLQLKLQADEPAEEMQLVVKESQKAAEEQPIVVQQTQPIMMSPVEEPAMQDETEELRRRATERIAKLRNLSFNINAADPNNEFETVPAYLRRNMEIHNQIANVENFYSNYTVKSDDNNQAEISTINTFLDGKKPD